MMHGVYGYDACVQIHAAWCAFKMHGVEVYGARYACIRYMVCKYIVHGVHV